MLEHVEKLAKECGVLTAERNQARRDAIQLEYRLTPTTADDNCLLFCSVVYGAQIWVSYESDPAQVETETDPAFEAQVNVLSVWLDGQWISAEDVLSSGCIEMIESEIVRELTA